MKPYIVLLLLFLPLLSSAQRVDESSARQRAQTFLQQRGKTLLPSQRAMRVAAEGSTHAHPQTAPSAPADYYVFNVGKDEGFVVVSGDDRTPPILGYADRGSISTTHLPDGLQFLLSVYSEELASLSSSSPSSGSPAASQSSTRLPIAPMVQTRWNQGAPYYNDCPESNDTHAVTGCVATAMAQVMYFHQYPTGSTTALPGYTTRNKLFALEDLPATTFSWSDMALSYASSATGASADAVAKLMQYCGWSLQMNYNLNSNGGSSAYNVSIAEALKTSFGYDGSISYVQRHHYTYEQWVNMIFAELAAGHPVVLGGQATGGGHSFVCDGYDTDDYFHINWGWGGVSDGYFRLSALNPYEQGLGGSSSLDGFSFTQDAVIGIKPFAGNTPAVTLALEHFGLDDAGTMATTTITRTSADEAFTGLPVCFDVCNYRFDVNTYDVALLLTNNDGETVGVLGEYDSQTINFNTDLRLSATLSTPTALPDGTYYINVVSRVNGTSDWQPCYDGLQQQLTVTVSGNSLTLVAPIVYGTGTVPTAVTFAVSGNQTQGYEQTVVASVTGSTVADYYGNLVLRVNGTPVMGKTVEIPAGKTVDVSFSYIPTTSGTNTLALYTARSGGTLIGASYDVAIAESDATDDIDLNFTYVIDNLTGNQLYGNALRATVTVQNPSTTNTYVGQLNCSTRQWTSHEEEGATVWSWESLGVARYPLVVDKEGSTTIDIAVDNLPTEGFYSFRLTYQRSTAESSVADAVHIGLTGEGDAARGSLTITNGYALGDATGATTIHKPSTSIDAGSACFVDLRRLTDLSTVTLTPSSNPNCLYLLAADAEVPASIGSCNVVRGSEATILTLTDGYDFYTPIDFTATTASYTRTFTLAAAGTSGWNTICLPFTVGTVTVDGGRVAKWFTADDDSEGSFWLRAFTADGDGTVAFDHAQEMRANTPYIIAVPDDRWGEEWQMTGRPITFSGSNVALTATATATLSGNHYKFCGSTTTASLSDVYVLNTKGSKFVKAETHCADPFRAWFSPVSISSLTLPSLTMTTQGTLRIVAPEATPSCTQQATGWYTLDGRKLSEEPIAKGLYIHNGKKVIK